MKNTLLLFAGAATLALSTACNRDKPAAVDAAATPSADTAVVVDDDADMTVYQDQANRTADQVAADLGVSDTAKVRRFRNTYYTRAQRIGDLDAQYETDTAGRYAATRQIDTDTDTEVRTILGDDAQYRTYETNRSRYYGSGTNAGTASTTTVTTTTTTTETAPARPARRRQPRIVKYENKNGEVKIVYANGTTVKIDKDGDRKVEYANGTKVKRDADDGEVKVKD
ncbi:T-complex 10 C-terminal domain-containing protein [Hymenobacter latericus]|uniref:T-complex 10 C-terminal domain-containing protein n=1 Tax=Hymenobacter sp. YIM 151858-1 TaxID=2987688 RepID=UPI00222714AC|nr:T-complex 10 C-terminal domain-containing protein [Hymenobacter sp. YIM 151858-1]UYZ57954.1 T-complex 10 C-terminal domain-containing protein [Hymenobacter sp. YIM 151858-1]